MIIDAFPFSNETLLLKLRLEMLSPIVDLFAIQEVGETFTRKKKGLIARQIVDELGLSDRVIYQNAECFPSGLSPFECEWFQRDLINDFLQKNLGPGDYLIYGDVDEIPRPDKIEAAIREMKSLHSPFAAFAQDMHYSYFNFREKTNRLKSALGEQHGVEKSEQRWIGSLIWEGSVARNFQAAHMRNRNYVDLREGLRISNGGWHFSYVDGPGNAFDRFIDKLSNSAHQEFNNEAVHRKFQRRVSMGKDPLGRRGVRFERVGGESLPIEVRKLFVTSPDKFL